MQALTPSQLYTNGAQGTWSTLVDLHVSPTSPSPTSAPTSSRGHVVPDFSCFNGPTSMPQTAEPIDPEERAKARQHALRSFANLAGEDMRLPLYQAPIEVASSDLDALAKSDVKDGERTAASRITNEIEEGELEQLHPQVSPIQQGTVDAQPQLAEESESDEDGNDGDRYPTRSKGKWKEEDDSGPRRSDTDMGYPKTAQSVEEWVTCTTPLLREYADRQICPPLGDRVNVDLCHSSQFVTGMFQMMANHDPQSPDSMLDNYTNIHRWAEEYLRGRFKQSLVGENVATLLTIVVNNFYEAHMRLVDQITEKALTNMESRKGPSLEVADFAFGFDLYMSQEMPFFVDIGQRVRDTVEAHRLKSPEPKPVEPATTRYGRQTKMTKMAQLAAENEQEKLVKPRQRIKAAAAATLTHPQISLAEGAIAPAELMNKARGPKAPAKPRARTRRKPQPKVDAKIVDISPCPSSIGLDLSPIDDTRPTTGITLSLPPIQERTPPFTTPFADASLSAGNERSTPLPSPVPPLVTTQVDSQNPEEHPPRPTEPAYTPYVSTQHTDPPVTSQPPTNGLLRSNTVLLDSTSHNTPKPIPSNLSFISRSASWNHSAIPTICIPNATFRPALPFEFGSRATDKVVDTGTGENSHPELVDPVPLPKRRKKRKLGD